MKFMDMDGKNKIKPIEHNIKKIMLCANIIDKPEYITQIVVGAKYKAINVTDKIYIPNTANTI